MDSSPRRWVLKPLSPLLQPSDLRTMAGPAPGLDRWDSGSLVVLQENGRSLNGLMEVQHVTVLEDGDSEDWHPSSPCSSSGSQSGFYSFVEDPTSPEAELNEAWMVSPQRQAQLAVLKKERGFKLQTYSSNKKPESLFSESNGDSLYRADPNNGMTLMDEDEEKQFRKMIIHSQAPKRSQTEAQTHGGALEPKLSTDRLIEGLSLRFSPAAAADPPPAEPGTIVKEQIDFGAARQKFLQMEQDQRAVMLSPGRSPTAKLNLSPELDADVYVSRKVKIFGTTNATDDTPLKPAEKDEAAFHRKVTVFQSEGRLSRESSVFDHLDSDHDSLSHEGVGGYTSNDSQLEEPHQDDWNKPRVFQETPIEREIRLTQEREEELRRSRGLKHSVGREEMVRIKTSSSRLSLTSDRTFEKNPVSFIIHSKIRKEEDPQEPERRGAPPQPDPQDEKRRTGDRLESDSGADDVFLSPCCPHRHPEESCFSQPPPATSSFSSLTARDSKERRQTASSSTPPVSVTPTTLHGPQGWRKSLASTGLQSRGQGTPDFIEKEIEESLKRELELRELRESMKKIRQTIFSPAPLVEQASKMAVKQFYPPVKTETPVSLSSSSPRLSVRPPSVSFITAKPWTSLPPPAPSSPVVVQTVPLSPRGLTETLLQDFEERRAKLKLEDSAYAGIQPVDDINNQVVESTRVARHKNQRALLWEAGLFANQDSQ